MMIAMLSAIANPAGGLRYHWRAMRHGHRWQPFLQSLHAWLDAWRPASPHLVLVGPSAGWCLPDDLFRRFLTLDVLEPDPLARIVLTRRLRGLGRRARHHELDCLAPNPEPFDRLTHDFPEHAILFCNVLGQVRWLQPELEDPDRFTSWKAALASALDGREWATFHDRLSGPVPPRILDRAAVSTVPLDDEQLAATFYEGAGEILSHGTADLFPGLTRRYLGWEIVPGQYHLIEAIRSD